MRPNLSKLRFILKRTDLTKKERTELLAFLAFADDQDLLPIVQAVNERPAVGQSVLRNIRAKRAALAKKDRAVWKRILEEEIEGVQRSMREP